MVNTKLRHSLYNLPDGSVLRYPLDLNFDWTGRSVIPADIDIFNVDTNQKFPLGTRLDRGDDAYRYVEYGGTTAAGDVLQQEAPDAAHDDLNASGGNVAAGSTLLTIVTSLTLVENEYAGGSLVVEADTGEGYRYEVLKNDADAAAGGATVTIRDGLAVAIDASSDVKLVKSRFKEVIQLPTTITGALAGIGIAVGADGSFGWVQTGGDAAVLTNGTVVIGQHVRAAGATDAGAVQALDRDGTAEDEAALGVVVDVGPTAEFSLIRLSGAFNP